jgi:uncharacterized membrane protein YeaQ/YmgE (transglycosylase-associated protein family)
MSLLVYLIGLAVAGLVVGAFARLALPGRDPMTIPQTILLGIAGSFLAGLFYLAVFGRDGGGFLLSLVFATLILYLIRRSRGGDLLSPGRHAERRGERHRQT